MCRKPVGLGANRTRTFIGAGPKLRVQSSKVQRPKRYWHSGQTGKPASDTSGHDSGLWFFQRRRGFSRFLLPRLGAKFDKFGGVPEPSDRAAPRANPRRRFDETIFERPEFRLLGHEIHQSGATHFTFD